MKEVFTAKSVEDAKAQAAEKFGVSVEKIVFRILEEPKKVFLFGKKGEAKVEATYEPIEEETAAPVEETASVEASAPAQPEEAAASAPETEAEETPELPAEKALTEEEMTPNLKKARQYIIDIYQAMDITVSIATYPTESGVRMELSSQSKSGAIIGRRGETLDSIQYLASILVNKEQEEYCRLLLDSNGYREKRRKTLEQLAEKIAKSVLKNGRSTTLEPMNPYERRIIHSRIAEIEGVTSRSVGEDPYRKVIISSVNGRRGGGNRGGRNYSNRNGGGKRPYKEKQPEEFKRKNLDSMKTSFERDYKKPKPEDELNAGLYGKIEF